MDESTKRRPGPLGEGEIRKMVPDRHGLRAAQTEIRRMQKSLGGEAVGPAGGRLCGPVSPWRGGAYQPARVRG